jgi:quinoprotein dehydrogenase-associated probable ABC transporter substrate-binding protein
MSSVYKSAVILALAGALGALVVAVDRTSGSAAGLPPFRVCADPNNLPFSNQRGEGFENRIAALIAGELGRRVTYTWWPQRRGFARNTLSAGTCDVIAGVPAGYELAWTTRPYYRSTYVFVTRRDRGLQIRSFDDPALRTVRIGLHVIGDDYSNVPPAQVLANRSIISNIRGYSVYGDYSKPNPPAALIDAVARDEIDVAIAWGPLAGFFATREPAPLALTPVSPDHDGPMRLSFAIAMAVRRGDTALHDAIDRALVQRREDIDAILRRFGVPLLKEPQS